MLQLVRRRRARVRHRQQDRRRRLRGVQGQGAALQYQRRALRRHRTRTRRLPGLRHLLGGDRPLGGGLHPRPPAHHHGIPHPQRPPQMLPYPSFEPLYGDGFRGCGISHAHVRAVLRIPAGAPRGAGAHPRRAERRAGQHLRDRPVRDHALAAHRERLRAGLHQPGDRPNHGHLGG